MQAEEDSTEHAHMCLGQGYRETQNRGGQMAMAQSGHGQEMAGHFPDKAPPPPPELRYKRRQTSIARKRSSSHPPEVTCAGAGNRAGYCTTLQTGCS